MGASSPVSRVWRENGTNSPFGDDASPLFNSRPICAGVRPLLASLSSNFQKSCSFFPTL